MGYDPKNPNWQGQPQQPPTGYGQQFPQQFGPGQQPPPGYGQQPPPGYGQGQYPGGMPPNFVQPQPQPQKKSRRWLWITLGIVGGLIVLICGGCAIASAAGLSIFGSTVTKVIGPTTTANAYYQAIKNQQYATAYSYLDTSVVSVAGQQATSEQAFTTVAQLDDTTRGAVTSFSQTGVTTSTDGATATVTMSVTRNSTYTVTIQLKQENGTWKIIKVDNI